MWWTVLIIAALIGATMVSLILFTDAGTWFTVVAMGLFVAFSVLQLRRLSRERRRS